MGRAVYPTKQGTRISASKKDGPRKKRLFIFWGNKRDNRGEEEGGGGRGGGYNPEKGVGGGGGDNNDYNGEYHCRHLPYYSSSWIEADAAEDITRHLEEVRKK